MPATGATRDVPGRFAGAEAALKDARFAIGGAPYDLTSLHRFGAREGPLAIRRASWTLEPWSVRTGVHLRDLAITDLGDVSASDDMPPEEVAKRAGQFWEKPVQAGAFPILLGGDATAGPALVHQLAQRHRDLRVIRLGARLAWRDAHHGHQHGEACALRRMADVVGPGRVAALGVRSMDREEAEKARAAGTVWRTSFDAHRAGMSRTLYEIFKHIGPGPIHLSLHVDALDLALAPGTDAPEPYGLDMNQMLAALQRCASRLVGLDVAGVSPAWDGGQTAILAARLVRDAMDEVTLAR